MQTEKRRHLASLFCWYGMAWLSMARPSPPQRLGSPSGGAGARRLRGACRGRCSRWPAPIDFSPHQNRHRRGDHWSPAFSSPPFFSFSSLRKKRTAAPGEEKERKAMQNRECKPCHHRVRRSQLHSVSAGAAKTPYPLAPSSFPNCDRFTGSQFGHLEFYNAARDLDDGGSPAFYGYGL